MHKDYTLRSALMGIETSASNACYCLIETMFKGLQVQKILMEGPIFNFVHAILKE